MLQGKPHQFAPPDQEFALVFLCLALAKLLAHSHISRFGKAAIQAAALRGDGICRPPFAARRPFREDEGTLALLTNSNASFAGSYPSYLVLLRVRASK